MNGEVINNQLNFKEMNNEKIVNGLNDLLAKNYDSERGYQHAAKESNSPLLTSFYRGHSSRRNAFGHEIKDLISECGGTPKKGTSILGDIHNAWIDVKTAFSSDKEEALLEAVETGEEACLKDYDAFLKMEDLPANIVRTISRQRNQVAGALNKVEMYEEQH